ncbi:MAG: HEPN domain-containing protein [Candidatus Aminicenantales bacterium]
MRKRKIRPFSRGKSLARKEIESVASDLEIAEKTYLDGNYKWATVQLYYSMFHSARALLFSKNLREHSYFCLVAAIRALFVGNQQFSSSLLDGLKEAKSLREDADYYGRWSKRGCQKLLDTAHQFLDRARKIVDKKNRNIN